MNKELLNRLNESIKEFDVQINYSVVDGIEINKKFRYLDIIFDDQCYLFQIEVKHTTISENSIMKLTYELQLAGMMVKQLQKTINKNISLTL